MKDILLCGSCGEPFTLGDNLEGEICFICHKECHFHCSIHSLYYNPSLPDMEALKNIYGWVCKSCLFNLELQIINTLPLTDLPKYLNYSFQNEQIRLRLLERMANE
jgi:hypothetical protein